MRVLFLGNSQIVSVGNLPQLVRNLAASARAEVPRIESGEVAIGGANIKKVWEEERTRAELAQGKYDWVLCHEIVYSYGGNGADLREYGRKIFEAAQTAGTKLLCYASGDIEGQRQTHAAMYQDAVELARECGGRVAGGGMAWLKAWEKRPELDFHCPDRAHAGELGYYLNACVVFAALTDSSPVGLDALGLPSSDARFLQEIAWAQAKEDRRNEQG
jgi:hypothetical protein